MIRFIVSKDVRRTKMIFKASDQLKKLDTESTIIETLFIIENSSPLNEITFTTLLDSSL